MEQGSNEMKRQGRYPEYTVYSHPIPQRALAIATLILQMKNSEHLIWREEASGGWIARG